MSKNHVTLLVVTLASFPVLDESRASDLPAGMKIQTFVRPTKSSTTKDRAALYVPKTPDFYLNDGSGKITPAATGCVCTLERAQGDQVLLWIRSQGLRGWAPAGSIVPLNHAEVFFTARIQADPSDAFALLMRGVVRYENDDVEQAFTDVDQALKRKPDDVMALLERAYLWQCRDRLDLAIADANRAIALNTQVAQSYVERGVFYFSARDYRKAQRDFAQAIRLGSRSPAVHLCQGMIHMEQGEGEPAIAEFNVAIKIDPARLDAYLGLATVYLMRSDPNKALAVFNRAIEVSPQSAEAYDARAIYFLTHGKFDKALDDLDEAVRLDPTSAAHLRSRARVCYEKGDFDRALADLESATRLDPNDPEALQGQAWILATNAEPRIRNGAKAVRAAYRACELTQWKVPHGLATLAAAYSETGDFPSAIKCQEQALALLGEHDPAKHEYRKLLDRYKAKKPYHRMGLLEEMGVRQGRPATPAAN